MGWWNRESCSKTTFYENEGEYAIRGTGTVVGNSRKEDDGNENEDFYRTLIVLRVNREFYVS